MEIAGARQTFVDVDSPQLFVRVADVVLESPLERIRFLAAGASEGQRADRVDLVKMAARVGIDHLATEETDTLPAGRTGQVFGQILLIAQQPLCLI